MTGRIDGRRLAALGGAIMDSAHALVVTLDTDGRVTGFNRACELLTGYEADEIIGTHIWDRLLPGASAEPVKRIFRNLRAGGEVPAEYENAWVTRDGRQATIAWNNSVLRGTTGEIELVLGIGVDITERKAVADRLTRAQQIAGIGSWEWNIETGLQYWSEQLYANLGLKPDSVVPSLEAFLQRVHSDDREEIKRKIDATLLSMKPYTADYRVVWPDGTVRQVHAEADAVANESGRLKALSGSMQDVTELRATESRLKRITDSFANAQRIARTGNWDWDAATGIEWWSDEVYRMLDLKRDEVEPTIDNFLERVHPDDRAKVRGAIDTAQEQLASYEIDFRVLHPGGEQRVIRETGECVLSADGKRAGLSGTIRDITEQQAAEQALASAARRLEAAMRLARLGNWEWDPATNRLTMSDETLRICGLRPEETVVDNRLLMNMIPEEERGRVLEMMRRAVADGQAYTNEYHIVRPNGDVRTVFEHGQAHHDETTRTVRLFGTIQDITEQRQTEYALQRSEARLRGIFENAPVGIGLVDLRGHLIQVNQQYADFLGYRPAEMVGLSYRDVTQPDFMEASHRQYEALLDGTISKASIEKQFVRSDGTFVWGMRTVSVIHDDGGTPRFMVVAVEDIDDRKRTEKELVLATESLKEAERIAHIGNWDWRPGSDATKWSDEMFRIFGLEPGSVRTTRQNFFHRLHEEDRESVATAMTHTIETGEPYEKEFRIYRADGEMRHVFERGERFLDEKTGEAGIRGVLQDITERKAFEEKLLDTAEKLEKSQRAAKIGSWVWEIAEDREWWSDEVYRMYAMEVGEVVEGGYDFLDYVHPADRERTRAALDKSVREGVPYIGEYRIRRRDGREIVLSERGDMEYDADGQPVRMRGTVQDITERKKAEWALQEAMERLEEAQQLAQMGSFTWDEENDETWWSDELYRIFGFERGSVRLNYWSFLDFVHPDDRDKTVRIGTHAIDKEIPYSVEYRVVRPDGTEHTVFEQAAPVREESTGRLEWRGVVQDITDRKRIEEELARLNAELEQRVEERTAELRSAQVELVKSERLATLGQLTATVSHELRNPLGAMRTSMYVIEKKLESLDSGLEAAVDRVNRNITRCDQIIDELLDYTRIRDLSPTNTNIDAWLEAILDEQTVPVEVEVIRNFGAEGVEVFADVNRLRRAFINVFENACQAATGPRTAGVKAKRARVTVQTGKKQSRFEIRVSDNGPGIAEDMREKIFEPLFSTKNFGVGLGLPTVKQIMEQHSGGVEIAARRGGGATFVLWLPLAARVQSRGT